MTLPEGLYPTAQSDTPAARDRVAKVSVLVVAYHNRATIGAVLESLRAQRLPPHEVIIVESGSDDAASLVRDHLPSAQLLVYGERLFPGAAHNRAFRAATGEILACLDADSEPAPDWTERIAAAVAEGHTAVAGSVLNARDSTVAGWAYFLSEFAPWLPSRERTIEDAPTCNIAYRRAQLESVGGFTEKPLLSADSLFHWQLRKAGTRLRFRPEVRVHHRYVGTAREMLARRFAHGRSLSIARRNFMRIPLGARLAWAAAAAVLLPPFYVVRLFVCAFGHGEVPLSAFVRALPLTICGLVLWALGQACGLLDGEPEASDECNPTRRTS